MWETWVWSLGWEDPPEMEKATYSSILAWRIPWAIQSHVYVSVSSVAQSCPTLCNPMGCSTPGLPVHHQLPEFTQNHDGDAIQPSHPLSSPSPTFNRSQDQSFQTNQFFTSGGQSIGVSASVSVLLMNTQDWFSLGLSSVFSSTTIQKHQFFSAQPSLWSNSHICPWLLENHSFD